MSDFLNGKLDNQEIKQKIVEHTYASGYKPTLKLVDNIIEQFWFHDFYNSFLSDEIYLNCLIIFLSKKRTKKFDRFEFYNFFFDQIINRQKRKSLSFIALNFERHLNVSVSLSDYEDLLKKLNISDNDFDVNWMMKKHLGKIEKLDEKIVFTWEHHTLTEFLVADYLIQKQDLLPELNRLMILEQGGITSFISSWSGVLRFLLESSKKKIVFKWLIEFLENNKDNIDDNISELITFIDVNLTKEFNSRVFNLVYGAYFDRSVWIPVWTTANLGKFIEPASYEKLKGDLKESPDQTKTFIRRGNIVSIIGGLLKRKSKFITKKDKSYWERKIISFINNPNDQGNGVLQRHSLHALAKLKKPSLIPLVENVVNTSDSLLRDEFMQFCIETDPNSKYSIINFIKGIKSGSDIYARHGLYQITKERSLKYLLTNICEDEQFWRSFFEHESIFNKKDGDQRLIENIRNVLNKTILDLLKKMIFKIFNISNIYQEGKSNFIRQIVLMINSKDTDFIFEILEKLSKQPNEFESLHLFFDYGEILALLLTPNNVVKYFNKTEGMDEKIKEHASSVVYIARRINGAIGQAVYEKVVELKKIKPINEKVANFSWEKQQKKIRRNVIKEFKKLLEPSPKKYVPTVFEYYLQNKTELDEYFRKKGGKEKKRLIMLAVDEGIKKINPQEFTVTMLDKQSRQFTWSTVASYYGNVLSIVNSFVPEEISKHRKNIIDFIPYAYSDDMSLIIKLIDKLDDKELKYVNRIMIDKRNDTRYLIPGTYIYLVGHYAKKECKLPNTLPVLKSFIGDEYIPDYEQRATVEAMGLLTDSSDHDTKKILMEIIKSEKLKGLYEVANTILIQIYKDDKAIDWRINEIKKPLMFHRIEGVHTPSEAEMEIDWMAFAKPIINLKDEKYLNKFFELLDYSFWLLKEKEKEKSEREYWEYINYLWRIVISFIENLKENGSFIPILALEFWLKKHSENKNCNWLRLRVMELKRSYVNYVRPFDKLSEGIEELSKTNIPAGQIAYFLFKAQIVETKLRDLVAGINYFLELSTKDFTIYRKATSKKIFKEFTLGQLKAELCKYQGKSLAKLDTSLSKFKTKRNEFTHELFLQSKDIRELAVEAVEHTKDAEESLGLIQETWKEILKLA